MNKSLFKLSYEESRQFVGEKKVEERVDSLNKVEIRVFGMILVVLITLLFIKFPVWIFEIDGEINLDNYLPLTSFMFDLYIPVGMLTVFLNIFFLILLRYTKLHYAIISAKLFGFLFLFDFIAIWLTGMSFAIYSTMEPSLNIFYSVLFIFYMVFGVKESSENLINKFTESKNNHTQESGLRSIILNFLKRYGFFCLLAIYVRNRYFVVVTDYEVDWVAGLVGVCVGYGMMRAYSLFQGGIEEVFESIISDYYLFRYSEKYRQLYGYGVQTWYGRGATVYKDRVEQLNVLMEQEADYFDSLEFKETREIKKTEPRLFGIIKRWIIGPLVIVAFLFGLIIFEFPTIDSLMNNQLFAWFFSPIVNGFNFYSGDIFFGMATMFFIGFVLYKLFVYYREFTLSNNNGMARKRARIDMNEHKIYEIVPYEGSYFDLAWFFQEIGKGSFTDFFTATLMDWQKKGMIKFIREDKPAIHFLGEKSPLLREYERDLYFALHAAAESGKVLTLERLVKAAESGSLNIQSVPKTLKKDSLDNLTRKRYVTTKKIKMLFYIKQTVVTGTESGEQLYNRIVQFQNYLMEGNFPQVESKSEDEWYDFIVWASLYGIEREVFERLRLTATERGAFEFLRDNLKYREFAEIAEEKWIKKNAENNSDRVFF